jgi:Subtilase family
MNKNLTILLVLLFLLHSCRKNKTETISEAVPPDVLEKTQLNAIIKDEIGKNGAFNWSEQSAQIIWSAGNQSDHIYAIGYKPANESNVESRLHNINIKDASWTNVKQRILQIVFEEEGKLNASLKKEQIEIWPEDVLPVIDVQIKNFATIERLQKSGLIRYIEPMGYEPVDETQVFPESSSGCGSNVADPNLVAGTHYTTIANNAKQSWNYGYHNIPSAWTKSTGAGIKIFVIDTGTSPDQDNLGSAFNQGNSSGRTIEKIVTLPRSTFFGIPTGPAETPADGCGHGTSMAGAAAAPRGIDGAAVGVAYNSNLVSCRAATDVLIDDSRENKGVADAFVNAANRADVKIISMSMGRITGSSQIADAVRYANGKGKLMFIAGGTSFSWSAGWFGVTFPATMSEVQAVTGVRENTNFSNCTECHKGNEIDFVVVMERVADGIKPITLAMSGNAPSTVGGSSVATATTAGIAALVWSRYPSYTTAQLLAKLQQSSSRWPAKSSEYGWGTINADAATN